MKPVRVALVVVMILAMMVMASCGIIEYIIKAIANWSNEVFRYEVTQELRLEEPDPELPDTQYYDSLEEALEAVGVTTEHCNVQMPEGYVFHDVRVAEVSNAIKILAEYTHGENEIIFTIWHYKDSTSLELNATEKIPLDAEIYIQNGIKHYILENSDATTASWIIGTEKYSLLGVYSADIVKQMINSIYKG